MTARTGSVDTFASSASSVQNSHTESYTTRRTSRTNSMDDKVSRKSKASGFSRKTIIGDKLRQAAMFANNIAMEDEQELTGDGRDSNIFGSPTVDEEEDMKPGETGAQRLQRALTTETKQKGLFRFANTLGSAVGIEPDVLMRVALEDEWQMVSCASLPFTVIFFVVFMLFFQLHYGVTDIYLAEAALRDKLGTPATNVDEAIQIYDWLENSYFPYLWTAKADATYTQLINSPSLYQELVAGVRISTTVAKQTKCADEIVDYLDCYTEYDTGTLVGNGIFFRRLQGAGELEQQLVEKANKNSKQIEGRSQAPKELPYWAKPGLSESWQKHLKKQEEKPRLELRQKKHTAEARHWTEKSSRGPVDKKRKSWKYSILFPGWRSRKNRIDSEQARGAKKDGRHQTESSDDFERRLRINRPEIRPATPRPTDGNKSQITIPTSWDLSEALAEVGRWRAHRVIQERTLTFTAEALVLNKNLAHDLLSSVVIDFSVHRGGNVFTQVKIVTLVFDNITSEMFQLGMGVLWLMCLLMFSVMLPYRAFMRWRQGKLRSHFLRFWNLLEWGIILWGWLVLIVFVIERSQTMSLKSDIDDYMSARSSSLQSDRMALDVNALGNFLETSSSITELSSWCQTFVALYHIILVCRFFLASRGQPRLAVVLSTIRKASVDLGHLFIVFMIIFIAYAVSGHILFGRRMDEFATFPGAFARCFQIVMEREYTWAEFTEQDLWTATIWVWSFLLLVVLVLVNIFLAMIFDTYGDVRSSVGQSATLWQTTKIVFEHLRHMFSFGESATHWVSNREIVQAIKSMQCNYVTPWMLKDAFPGISNRQVNYVFNLGKNRLETMLLRGNKSSLPAVIASILLGVERMTQGLQLMQGNASAAAAKQSERKSSEKGSNATAEELSLLPPSSPPPWLKVQLLPHFQKQRNILTQAYVQIQAIERALTRRGLRSELGQIPGTTARKCSLGTNGINKFSANGLSGVTPRGMLPVAQRSGMTALNYDSI